MSSREVTVLLPTDFSPLERILLTANGNVQRILSSFHNSTVTVKIIKNNQLAESDERVPNGTVVFDREVNLLCKNKVRCNATSLVKISNPEYLKLVLEQKVGIGQLFSRYLNVLPEFKLLKVGKSESSFWRDYSLSCPGIECILREVFPLSVFEIEAEACSETDGPASSAAIEIPRRGTPPVPIGVDRHDQDPKLQKVNGWSAYGSL
ncbi:uncharacterized protein BJ171DRAFT_427130 [Polychytrium aggregatum]|uniref:uncharacterized protein n=1 Tax=Polychytrium aggregatum TaxID=110093 RepID=UPI0022FEDCB0|nr:uncharacterized protein BJ171DRAFT_427130 [Polychytrium aggregatum]KAI9201907.1 hypothetical protein BJ171DRAFT_427130 [Polychytrium aggregatum]